MRSTKIVALLLLVSALVAAKGYAPVQGKMTTRWASQVSPESVWKEYPRPQFERREWMNLNGLWDYAVLDKKIATPQKFQGKILVPFAVESALSGVGKELKPTERLWYKREFTIPAAWKSKNVIINFDAIDYEAVVYVNDAYVGSHKGMSDRFSFDITPYLKPSGKQEIVVSVDDPSSNGTQPRGKQRIPPGGIWYTTVSGIFQTVWLEPVATEAYIQEVKITPNIDNNSVEVTPMLNDPKLFVYKVNVEVLDGDKIVAKSSIKADFTETIKLDAPKFWSPDSPFLYNLKLTLTGKDGIVIDEVKSYFGMRKISLGDKGGNKVMLLNNKPLFHYGTLDQGWWPDGLLTPPSDEAQLYDIEMTKKMGFNMIRKHIKVENDRWFYHCDRLGMLVWQDMPSGMAVEQNKEGRPVGLQHVKITDEDFNHRSDDAALFEYELRRMIDLHYNAPSVVVWVPMNEGWGQYATCRIAKTVKQLDPTRLVNAVSGWALRPCGDIYDIHTYGVEVGIPAIDVNRASVIGEYGGVGYPVNDHLWNPESRNWGYQTYQSQEELIKAYKHKFDQIVDMYKKKGLSGAVYTQITDVEVEVNGLITYDREYIKIPVEELNKIHSELLK